MKIYGICLFIVLVGLCTCKPQEDNEFAEFEDFEEDEQQGEPRDSVPLSAPSQKPLDEGVQLQDDEEDEAKLDSEEFDHFQDSEEFEGLESNEKALPVDRGAKPDLKITKVPLHLRSNWQSYYAEILMMSAIAVYFINFLAGRSKNAKLASAWFEAHRPILDTNFALVGDDGLKEIEQLGLRKESENCFTLWCSGRQCVEGMLVELKLIKRQCLVATITQIMRPASDQVMLKLNLDSMDPLVFCVATKKASVRLSKELLDLITFCPDRKSLPDKAQSSLGDNFVMHSELGEVSAAFFGDARITSLMAEFRDYVEYLHVSDQFCGPRLTEEQQQSMLKRPQMERIVMIGVTLPGKGKTSTRSMESMTNLMKLALYVADKVSRLKLSKEARTKAEKSRQRVEEAFLKTTHAQRQELAQQRREERVRAERERILLEEDPDKQRRLELKEQKRQAKKSNPKMKQMKVRAM